MVPEGVANPKRWIEQAFPTDKPITVTQKKGEFN